MSKTSHRRDNRSAAPDAPLAPAKSGRRVRRLLRRIVAAAVVAAVIVAGYVWWQERALAKAAAALESGDARYATYLATSFLQRHPKNSRALAIQARGLVAMGHPDEAIVIFDRIGAATAEDMRACARAYIMREEWTSGLRLLTRVLQLSPDDADALYELSSCQIRLGMYEEALENAQRFAETSGQSARGHLLVGSIYGYLRNNHEASKALQRVLQEEPDGENLQLPAWDVFLRYGRVLMALGKPQEALEPLKQSVARRQTGEAFVLLGEAASQLGHTDNAIAAWRKAVEVEPENLAARTALANASLVAGEGEQALEWLKPFEQKEELPSSITYLFQRTHTLLGNAEEAAAWRERSEDLRRREQLLSSIDSAMNSDPSAFWSRAARAHRFAAEGNWNQAELIVSGLIEEAPGEPFIIELSDAVRRRGKLPDLTRIPIVRY